MKQIVCSAVSLVLLALLSPARASQWCGITPLRSTRDDVEKALGRPTKPDAASYETEKERVHIIYSTVPCEEGVAGAWNVPPDTVIRIEVTPKKELRVNDLGLEESKYTKVEQPHVSGAITYVNEEEGILIKTSYDEVVAIHHGPSAKDKHLACPRP